MNLPSRLPLIVLLALLASAVAPAFARGQPQLPDDNGNRANVLRELQPLSAADSAAESAAPRATRHIDANAPQPAPDTGRGAAPAH
ncbi:hypothetical protein ACV229_02990 [Burkholderia sp. MR1-5-21]